MNISSSGSFWLLELLNYEWRHDETVILELLDFILKACKKQTTVSLSFSDHKAFQKYIQMKKSKYVLCKYKESFYNKSTFKVKQV